MTGAVTLPPGLHGRDIYLQDATGGIKVYLRSDDYPALAAGDHVRVNGWTRRYHVEIELSVPSHVYTTQILRLTTNAENSDLSARTRLDERCRQSVGPRRGLGAPNGRKQPQTRPRRRCSAHNDSSRTGPSRFESRRWHP